MSIVRIGDASYASCDNCGFQMPRESSIQNSEIAMKNAGWHTTTDEDGKYLADYCPYCWQELQEEQP